MPLFLHLEIGLPMWYRISALDSNQLDEYHDFFFFQVYYCGIVEISSSCALQSYMYILYVLAVYDYETNHVEILWHKNQRFNCVRNFINQEFRQNTANRAHLSSIKTAASGRVAQITGEAWASLSGSICPRTTVLSFDWFPQFSTSLIMSTVVQNVHDGFFTHMPDTRSGMSGPAVVLSTASPHS